VLAVAAVCGVRGKGGSGVRGRSGGPGWRSIEEGSKGSGKARGYRTRTKRGRRATAQNRAGLDTLGALGVVCVRACPPAAVHKEAVRPQQTEQAEGRPKRSIIQSKGPKGNCSMPPDPMKSEEGQLPA
jgi:hypothetical protein